MREITETIPGVLWCSLSPVWFRCQGRPLKYKRKLQQHHPTSFCCQPPPMFAAGGGMSLSVEKESGMRRERKEEVGVQPHTQKNSQRGRIVNARGQSTTNNNHDREMWEHRRDHSTLSLFFSSPPPGGSLYNIRLADDDGTVHPSRSRVFKPVKRMKNKQLMA